MSERNDKHEADPHRNKADGSETDYREVMDHSRQAAQRIDVDRGMIDPEDRQFTIEGNLDHRGSLTLRKRSSNDFEPYTLFPRSPIRQMPVENAAPRYQGPAQSTNQAATNDLLVITDVGQLVGQLRLAITADQSHRLLVPTAGRSTVSPFRIVTTRTGPRAILDPAPRTLSNVPRPRSSAERGPKSAITQPMMPPSVLPTKTRQAVKPKDWTKAVEKPAGATKAETDNCLTCIQYNRDCTGTDLIFVHGEYRCEKCAEKRMNTGSRKCLWKDPAKGVFTYKEAQAAAGRKELWANTVAGRAARKARKEEEGTQARDDLKVAEEEDPEGEEEESEEEGGEADLEDAVEAAWQELFRDIAGGLKLDLNDVPEQLSVLETMKALYEGVVEDEQEKPVEERRWKADVVTALETRLKTEINEAQITLNKALDREIDPSCDPTPLTNPSPSAVFTNQSAAESRWYVQRQDYGMDMEDNE